MFELGNECWPPRTELQSPLAEKLDSDPTGACGRWSVDIFCAGLLSRAWPYLDRLNDT